MKPFPRLPSMRDGARERAASQRQWTCAARPVARFAAAVLLPLALSACVDPQGRYDAFIDDSADLRNHDMGTVTTGERFDFSGRYLCALSTTLATDQPILFRCDVTVAADLSTLDLALQPLTTDEDAEPRAAVGDAQEAMGIPFDTDGTFTVDLGEARVPGAANPISGSDIVSAVTLEAGAHHASGDLPVYFCGRASGMVSEPIAFDLAGSTLGAVQSDDLKQATPLLACP